MKLSFTTIGCPTWSFDQIVINAKKMGYDAIEIRGINGQLRIEKIPEFFSKNIERTKNFLKEHSIEICVIGTSINLHDVDKFDENMEEGKLAIDVCESMEIKYIRVFGNKIEADNREKSINQTIKSLNILCNYAKDKGVIVLLEIHGDYNCIANVAPILEAFKDKKSFGILWDIAHSYRFYGDDFLPFYNFIKPYTLHIHVKDYKLIENGDFLIVPVGEGNIPIKKILETLKENDYKGILSFEWEKMWNKELLEPEIVFPSYINYLKSIKVIF